MYLDDIDFEKLFFRCFFAFFGFIVLCICYYSWSSRKINIELDEVVNISVREVQNVYKGYGFDVIGKLDKFGYNDDVRIRVDNIILNNEMIMSVRVIKWKCADSSFKWNFEFISWQ